MSTDTQAGGGAVSDGLTIPTTEALSSVSFAGVVDAILEVGKQRRAQLELLRSALVSGHDTDALGFARQLCGLPA
ncbi:MAG: hypothetical protein WCA10_03990 [Terracidiphilus sp.]